MTKIFVILTDEYLAKGNSLGAFKREMNAFESDISRQIFLERWILLTLCTISGCSVTSAGKRSDRNVIRCESESVSFVWYSRDFDLGRFSRRKYPTYFVADPSQRSGLALMPL